MLRPWSHLQQSGLFQGGKQPEEQADSQSQIRKIFTTLECPLMELQLSHTTFYHVLGTTNSQLCTWPRVFNKFSQEREGWIFERKLYFRFSIPKYVFIFRISKQNCFKILKKKNFQFQWAWNTLSVGKGNCVVFQTVSNAPRWE